MVRMPVAIPLRLTLNHFWINAETGAQHAAAPTPTMKYMRQAFHKWVTVPIRTVPVRNRMQKAVITFLPPILSVRMPNGGAKTV